MSTQWNIALGLKIMKVYLQSTTLYGFTRAVTWDYEGKKEYYNARTKEFETKEKLIVDKAYGVLRGAFAAYFVWPGMLSDDLTRLECAVKGREAREYGVRFVRVGGSDDGK
jgi:hypothetical protein